MSARAVEVAVIGGGPAGLAAAEVIAAAGRRVEVFDAMPSPGRKFLLAGIGGLNLTHSEATPDFVARYAERATWLAPMLQDFGADALRVWAAGLGIETFVGTSGRVFPKEMKAAPLLRAWLQRLRAAGVQLHVRHRWAGWHGERLRFDTPAGEIEVRARATVLALGGGSWARLGSDSAWLPWLTERGVDVAPLRPANCGFETDWSEHFRERFAGQPLKNVAASVTDHTGREHRRSGECIVTANGIEGGLIYALSAPLRDTLAARGEATLHLDLAPGRSLQRLQEDLAKPRGRRSLASHLQGKAGIDGVKAGLLRECTPREVMDDPARLAAAIKHLPLRLLRTRPLDEAISSAGGVRATALDDSLMLKQLPGVFCCGEMLDWEAPTGGYLLTACFATGRRAGRGVLDHLSRAGT
ncbi:MAG: TIGR03862 family flavoprotein [Pseudazoarcus pumilus]|nr:TIGR03862 family flavoprotein [Pseudazoarcus pumilus]